MGEGILHNGLQRKRGHPDRCRVHQYFFFHGDASIEPHLLQIDVIVQPVQLFLQRDHLRLGAEVVPEQAAQPDDHLVGGRSILQPGHAGDHVEGVEQKVGVHLAFQHLQPGVLQIIFQRQVPHLFPVQRLLCGVELRHGVLHLVESAHQLAHLVAGLHGQVAARKIVLRNAAARARQPQQRHHHGGGQCPQQEKHPRHRRCRQPQIEPRHPGQQGGSGAVNAALLFQRGLRQPQGVLREEILQLHDVVHLADIPVRCRAHLEKGVPVDAVPRIALQQVPGAGVAVLPNGCIVQRQFVQTLRRGGAGCGILRLAFLRAFPDIPRKGFGLGGQRLLHRVAGGVVFQQAVKGPQRPPPHGGGQPDGEQHHQQDGPQPPRHLCPERPASHGFFPHPAAPPLRIFVFFSVWPTGRTPARR